MKQSFNIPAGKFAGEGYQQQCAESMNKQRQRHGFVTFWLWFCIVCSALSGVQGLLMGSQLSSLGYYATGLAASGIDYSHAYGQLQDASMILSGQAVIGFICNVVGYVMLLNWKKAGFYVLIVASIVLSCVGVYAMELISDAYSEIGRYVSSMSLNSIMVFGSVFGWILLWAILQIKKNGVSYWSQLN
ncbi:MAG: hypothetical protein K2J00_07785 [Bacteroidaceae bacterium]|nr:hypothetical protein [Bacteroidaceae bacterium]